MSAPTTKTFQAIVQDAAAAVQGAASKLIDFSVGSVLRAVIEATAALALWMQGIALQIASLTRFSTSSGTDADSWAADYAFTRLPAQPAIGQVTFSRFTPTAQATVPVGTLVQTQDGSQQFAVIADTTQSAFNATLNAYVLAAGVASANATVQAATPSSAGNVGAGFINTISQTIPGIDTVTNASAFANGADSETDAAFRARFVLYIASLSKATKAAIGSAIASIQQDVAFSITENQAFNGTPQPGFFYVVVDDGSGTPPSTFLATVANAVDAVRPIGATFAVFAPSLLSASVHMTLTVDTGFDLAAADSAAQQAITNYINSLTIGEDLPYTRLAQLAYDSSTGVTNVSNVLLNGGTSDLIASPQQVIRAGSVVCS